ncbi:MAG: IS110 family transposase [Tenericutes bacterium]|nr:IS110 family transposase [Mycoplasmatota bacterium]
MYYIGIDVSKFKHTCLIASNSGEVIKDCFDIDNSTIGFTKLKSIIDSLDSNQIKIGFESTGHYSANLAQFLINNDYKFFQLDPRRVKKFSLSLSSRKTKTDKIDAGVIARFLMTVDSKANIPLYYHISYLKSLSRHVYRLQKYISKSKIELVNMLDQAFPEFFQFFSSIYGKTPFSILEKANSLKSISNMSSSRYDSLRKLSMGRFKYSKFIKLKHAASHSVGIDQDFYWSLIHFLIKRINALSAEKKSIEDIIIAVLSSNPSSVLTIPGISYLSCAAIISEIGDVNRFSNYRSLIAYAGLDNSVYQSGTNLKLGRISKRGSVYLRTALFKASVSIIMKSKLFYDYFFLKKSQGKHRTLVLTCVSRKLLRVIFHLLKTNTSFNDNLVS